MRRAVSAAILVLLGAGSAAAQSLEPAGREGRVRFAIDRDQVSRASDGLILAHIYEVEDQPRRELRYAMSSALFDCQAGRRSLRVREDFSSLRDPVKTTYMPALVTLGADDAAVAEQLRLVCGDDRRTPMLISDFLRAP